MKLLTSTKQQKRRGFILLISVLVSSIILAISLGVYSLSIKEVILASFLKQSSLAFGAADRGIECTLYWDRTATQNGMPYTIFSTSTAYATIPSATLDTAKCDTSRLDDSTAAPIGTGWTVTNTPLVGTTQFTLTYPDNTCAEVTVIKEGVTKTTIISNGYNTCDPSNSRRTQRTIQVTGNF